MQVCMYASMQACKHASMQVYAKDKLMKALGEVSSHCEILIHGLGKIMLKMTIFHKNQQNCCSKLHF